ncbi:YaaA family protein [Kytococcus sedentarius]|uniref:YaaA family protein n=1 Tax=Kytococcus sedentarius TaxID=1276 RepID=UPI0035BBB4E3
MLILLPPSESKTAPARGRAARPGDRSFPALDPVRDQVARAAAALSAQGPSALGLQESLAGEVERNTRLHSAPTARADAVYSGVLYDALDVASLPPAGRRRASAWCVVVSALHGAVRLGDRIPPYRLSMNTPVPELGPLAALWRDPLQEVLPEAAGSRGLVMDGRSSTYVAAWRPRGDLAQRWVSLEVPGATHGAKHTRGLVARAVCEHGLNPTRPAQLAEELRPLGFTTELLEPQSTTGPWRLRVNAA